MLTDTLLIFVATLEKFSLTSHQTGTIVTYENAEAIDGNLLNVLHK